MIGTATAVSATQPPPSPYVGLSYYTEAEAEVFFGREIERRLIIANLRASRLTLLYAQSGVGKSSLIRAGVASRLRELALARRAQRTSARHIPVVFSAFKDEPVAGLIAEIEAAIEGFTAGGDAVRLPRDDLVRAIEMATAATDATLLIILDQFEEHFLYRPAEAQSGRLAASLADCLSRGHLRANFLIAVREDAYAGVGELFQGRVENIYGNFLHLDYLGREAAEAAIRRPIAIHAALHPRDGPSEIDDDLVSAVLDQVRTGQVLLEQSGHGTVAASNGPAPAGDEIETPYLQLVMTTLWQREYALGSERLRLQTLRDLGGAQEIVRRHLDTVLADLSDEQRATAVDVFDHLVTPSGTKIAHTIADLAQYSGRTPEAVSALVELLSDGRRRILRPVAAGADGRPRVEIFHDVLAPAILDWRTRQTAVALEHDKQAAQASADRARRQARIFRGIAAGAVALLVIATGAVIFAEVQRSQADQARRQSDSAVLAGQGFSDLTSGALDSGALLGMEAYRAAPSAEARTDLMSSLVLTAGMAAYLRTQSGPINKVAFDPTGDLLASASTDSTILLWNLRTGSQQELAGDPVPLYSVAFSPAGRYLASADADGNVVLWNVSSERRVRTFSGHDGPLYDVAFAPNGHTIAAAGAGGSVIEWDLATGRELSTVAGHGGPVNAVAFAPRGSVLAAALDDGAVIIRDLATGGQREDVIDRGTPVTALAFSPDAMTLAAADAGGTAALIDVGSGSVRHRLRQSADALQAVAFSPDGQTVATAGDDHFVWLWDARSGQLLRTFQGQSATIESVAFSAGGGLIAAGSDDRSVAVWTTAVGSRGLALQSAHGAPRSIALDPTAPLLASANADGTVGVWNLRSGTQTDLRPGDGPLESVVFSRDGHELVTAGDDGEIVIWRAPSLTSRSVIDTGGANTLWSVALSPDGTTLAAGADAGGVLVYDIARRQRMLDLQGFSGSVFGVAFSPDGRTIAAGDADGTVILWSAQTGRRLRTLTGHTGAVTAVAFSPDGRLIAGASSDDSIILWHNATGLPDGPPLDGHQAPVESVAFAPDGRTLASGSADHTAIVWNLATRLGTVLGGHTNTVGSVAYSSDGATLASADFSGRILLDAVPATGDGAAAIDHRLCSVVRRNLSPQQWSGALPAQPYHRTCPAYT